MKLTARKEYRISEGIRATSSDRPFARCFWFGVLDLMFLYFFFAITKMHRSFAFGHSIGHGKYAKIIEI